MPACWASREARLAGLMRSMSARVRMVVCRFAVACPAVRGAAVMSRSGSFSGGGDWLKAGGWAATVRQSANIWARRFDTIRQSRQAHDPVATSRFDIAGVRSNLLASCLDRSNFVMLRVRFYHAVASAINGWFTHSGCPPRQETRSSSLIQFVLPS